MWVLLAITVLLSFMFRDKAPFDVVVALQHVHSGCVQRAPEGSHQELYATMVCAAAGGHKGLASSLQSTGLIHLALSQGLHLFALSAWLERAGVGRERRAAWHFALGVALCALLGFRAPILRATIAIALRDVSRRARMNWTRHHVPIVSGALCLAFDPSLWHSRALQLAWAGSLALGFARGHLGKCACAYMACAPLLLPIQGIHPASIIVSWAVAPVFVTAVFPLACLAFLIPSVASVSDFALDAFLGFASEIDATVFSRGPWIAPTSALGDGWRWPYVFALSIGAMIAHGRRARKLGERAGPT